MQGYGLTETCSVGATTPAFSNSKVPRNSVGLLAPNTQVRIVDIDSGKALPPNQKGEFWIRGPFVMEGTAVPLGFPVIHVIGDLEGSLQVFIL